MSSLPEYAQCDATLSRGVVNSLTSGGTEYTTFDPTSLDYYTGTVWPAVAPSIAGVCLYAAVLLLWGIWRVFKSCSCCCRPRRVGGNWAQARLYEATEEGSMVPSGYELKDKAGVFSSGPSSGPITGPITGPSKVHMTASVRSTYSTAGTSSAGQGRFQLVILTGAIIMGLGVIACSIYGLTTIRAAVVTDSVGVINGRGRGYVEDVLSNIQEAINVGQQLDTTVTGIEDQLQSGGLTSVVVNLVDSNDVVQTTIDSIQRDLQGLLVDAEGAVESVERDVLGAIDDAIAEYEPPAQRYNRYRFTGMYVLYSLAIFLALAMVTMALVRWPFLHSLSFFLFMVLMTLTCVVMVAHAGGIKVADDTCQNLEPYVVNELVSDPTTQDILRYYFTVGQDTSTYGDIYEVVREAFGIDVREVINAVEQTKQSVEQAIQGNGIQGVVVGALLQDDVDKAQAQADEIVRLIRAAVEMLQPEVVMNGVYSDIRGFFCCTTVDDLGDLWLGLTLTLSFGFGFSLFALGVTYLLDALPLDKWYRRYVPASRMANFA